MGGAIIKILLMYMHRPRLVGNVGGNESSINGRRLA
jgi:hypothetical protein